MPTEFRTVLLIEPIHRYRLFIESALMETEFEPVCVSDAGEALAILRGMTPHLILLEDNLPGCDVSRFLLELREHGMKCPVIVMSTKGSPDHIRKFAGLSISDFLVKPIDEARLVKSLRAACDPTAEVGGFLAKIQPRGSSRVLIADDIGASRRMLATYLKKNGYAPSEAGSGAEAVNCVLAGGVDILLLDYQMRDLNGLEVLQELRMKSKSVPTIMISAHGTPEIVSKARVLGAVDFFEKPVDFPLLINRIKDIAGRGKGQANLRKKVLVVEDDPLMRNLIAKALDPLEVDVIVAGDGFEARTELRFSNVDVVVLDMNLPGVDGVQILREIQEGRQSLRVVIASGCLSEEDMESLRQDPVTEIIPKPVDMNRLRKAVAAALSMSPAMV